MYNTKVQVQIPQASRLNVASSQLGLQAGTSSSRGSSWSQTLTLFYQLLLVDIPLLTEMDL